MITVKKFILPIFVLFISLTTLFILPEVNAQTKSNLAKTKGPLTCEEMEKIMDSKECPHWVIYELGLWCAQSFGELVYLPAEGDAVSLFKNRPPDYTLLSDNLSCSDKESAQPEQQPAPTSEQTPAKNFID